MFNAEFYNLLMEASGALSTALGALRKRSSDTPPAPPPLWLLRAGLAESPGWFLVQAAEFDPEPLTVARVRVRDIYASERIVQAILELMAGERWIDHNGAGNYTLAPAGRAILERSRSLRLSLLPNVEPYLTLDVGLLDSLLTRLIHASLVSPTPPGAWSLLHSRNRAPADDAPRLVRISQYFDDFNAFRDDAHMAAWQPYRLDGYVWEAFALLCTGEAQHAASVFDQLAYRGYSQNEYAQALTGLVGRGWLAGEAGGIYSITLAGRDVYRRVESATDNFFYGPWSVLAEAEVSTLQTLLRDLSVQAVAVA